MSDTSNVTPTKDDFATMFEESIATTGMEEGRVMAATVTGVENDFLILDVGLKTEGRVPVREFGYNEESRPVVGDVVEVYLERIENAMGDAILSREKAKREETWNQLEVWHNEKRTVNGTITGRVKGGFTVDMGGVSAFLPGSQVDIRPIRDIAVLMEQPQPFVVLKIDRLRGNIVVSRRAVLEESQAEQRAEIVGNMVEGETRRGVVKNITDYGVFVDLGGIDGLLHVTDMSWKRISHPSQIVEVGQQVEIKIIRINPDTQRISLGMKQLTDDPWSMVSEKYSERSKYTGSITNITEYGAFVELEDGIEGLIHVSEMSWTKKNLHPSKLVSSSQKVEVMVLEIDKEKRRISLGLKQAMENPWGQFASTNKPGSDIEGEIRGITEFGLFIALSDDLDGMVHINDIDWNRPGEKAIADYKKGDVVRARVLDIDVEKERIALGIKHLTEDPVKQAELQKNKVVTCNVTEVGANGVSVSFEAQHSQSEGFIRKSDLSMDRAEQRPERFAIGDKIDAMVTQIDKASRKITLSVKALEIREEKEAVAQYGSADSGALLGDILGAALAVSGAGNSDEPAKEKNQDDKPAPKKTRKKAAAKTSDDNAEENEVIKAGAEDDSPENAETESSESEDSAPADTEKPEES